MHASLGGGGSFSLVSDLAVAQSMGGSGQCGLSQLAFCDTFDQPYTGSGRTGHLDPSRWTVARLSGFSWWPSAQPEVPHRL